MVHRPGTRFSPNDLGAVRRYLRNMVERNDRGYLQVMDVYEKEPWLLDHVSNPLFKKNEWYYFVRRSKRGRIVKGRGDSEGGTWKSTSTKVDIKDGNENVVGYKRSLVFNRKVNGRNPEKTNWLMTEFTLKKNGGEFQDLVLVWIRYIKHNKGNLLGFNDAPRVDPEHVDQVPELEREHGDDLDNYINEIERMMLVEEDPLQDNYAIELEGEHGDDLDNYINEIERMMFVEEDPQQEQQDNFVNELETLLVEEDKKLEQQNTWDLALLPPQSNYNNDMMMLPPLPPSLQGQGFGFQTMVTESNENSVLMNENEYNVWMQSNNNNFMMHDNENNVFMQSNENNAFMQNNVNDFLMQRNENNDFMMQNNVNDFLMQSNENNNNNFLMQSNENNFVMQRNESNENNNNFMMQNLENFVLQQSNENNFFTQNNEDNFFMESNENNVIMQNNEKGFSMQRNDNYNFLWNQEEQFRLDGSGFEGAEFVMLDVDQLITEPITDGYNQEQQDRLQ